MARDINALKNADMQKYAIKCAKNIPHVFRLVFGGG